MKLLLVFLCAALLSSLAFGQTYYKCRGPAGRASYADVPCAKGWSEEQVVSEYKRPAPPQRYVQPQQDAAPPQYAQQPQYVPPQKSSDARMLDAKVAEALGTGDFRRAKGLALTSEHWQMIAAAEQRINQAVTGRTDADLRAELGKSQECKSAQRSYDIESSSIARNGAAINAAQQRMYAACGITPPTVVENRTIVNDNRRTVVAPRAMNCQQAGGGQIDCW